MPGESVQPPRDYGGWRRSRGIGLLGLGTTGTLTALGALLVLIVAGAADIRALIYVVPPVLAGGAAGLIRTGLGEPLAVAALRRARWWYGSARKRTQFRLSDVREHSPEHTLPGVLTSSTLLDTDDHRGGRYALILDERTRYLTATWRVVPASMWLADRDEADGWVANWGGWLAGLGYQPALRWVTVTVDTAPGPGSALGAAVTAALDPAAPLPARQIMRQLVDAAPAVAAEVDTRVSITVDPRALAAGPQTLFSAVAETGRLLPGLESALGTCGVSVLGRLTAAEIADVVRTAFVPATRGEVNRAPAYACANSGTRQLDWADAAPAGAEELADRYRHDSGTSVTWCWQEAPRHNVAADVLARLVAPGRFPKRVTLQYRPLPAAAAARLLESEVNAALFRTHYRQRTGRDETARDAFDQARARQAAVEEAGGAGVCLISLYVTTTVTDESELPDAVARVEAAAEASKIRLRRMVYSQAAGFAVTLPCGVCPADLARWMPR